MQVFLYLANGASIRKACLIAILPEYGHQFSVHNYFILTCIHSRRMIAAGDLEFGRSLISDQGSLRVAIASLRAEIGRFLLHDSIHGGSHFTIAAAPFPIPTSIFPKISCTQYFGQSPTSAGFFDLSAFAMLVLEIIEGGFPGSTHFRVLRYLVFKRIGPSSSFHPSLLLLQAPLPIRINSHGLSKASSTSVTMPAMS